MSVVQIQSFTVPDYREAEPVKLRVYANQEFVTSDGKQILPGERNFYKEISCSVASNTITVPAFNIDTTTDSSNGAATYSAYFVIPNRRKRYLFSSWSIPTSLGSTPSWTSLKTYNEATVPYESQVTYSQAEIDLLLQQYLLNTKMRAVALTSNQTWNANDTLADTALSVTVEAGGQYAFEATLFITTSSAGGFKWKIDGTSTDTDFIAQSMMTTANGTVITGNGRAVSRVTVFSVTGQTTVMARFFGSVTINAGGTFLIQAAQNASDASNTNLIKGSSLILRKTN